MNQIVKKLHIYLGLLNFANLLVFGIAGLTATFQAAPESRQRPEPAVRYEAFTPPATVADKEVAVLVYQKLNFPLAAPPQPWSFRRNHENNLTVDFYTANGLYRVVVLERENRVRIETTRNSLWQYLNNLHATTIRERTGDPRTRLWSYYIEFAIWSLIAMTLSGICLWLSSRPRHRLALACLVLGSGSFAFLYVLTR